MEDGHFSVGGVNGHAVRRLPAKVMRTYSIYVDTFNQVLQRMRMRRPTSPFQDGPEKDYSMLYIDQYRRHTPLNNPTAWT